MKDKLSKIYEFLKLNGDYNAEFQTKNLESLFSTANSHRSTKAYYLLHHIYNTQNKPKINDAKLFLKNIKNTSSLESVSSLCNHIGYYDSNYPYLSLYFSLEKQPGWGPKTSALFVKSIYRIHQLYKSENLTFWERCFMHQISNYISSS